MHGRRALSEQDCWSDIGGVVLRERRSHDKGGMDGPSGRGDLLSSLCSAHCRAIHETTGVTGTVPVRYVFRRNSTTHFTRSRRGFAHQSADTNTLISSGSQLFSKRTIEAVWSSRLTTFVRSA